MSDEAHGWHPCAVKESGTGLRRLARGGASASAAGRCRAFGSLGCPPLGASPPGARVRPGCATTTPCQSGGPAS